MRATFFSAMTILRLSTVNYLTVCAAHASITGMAATTQRSRFKKLADKFGYVEEAEVLSPIYHKGLEYEEVAPEILVTDFMSEDQCKRYIEASERLGQVG